MNRIRAVALALLLSCAGAGESARGDQMVYLWTWGYASVHDSLWNIPRGNDFVAIDGGGHHGIALRADGSIVCWGEGMEGTVGGCPAGNGFAAIAASGYRDLALRSDGAIIAWGQPWGEGNRVPQGNDFVAIAAGLFFGLALRDDGTLAAWGTDNSHSLDALPAERGFTAISAGSDHGLALRADGTIAAWGYDKYGQVSSTPTEGGFTAIASGNSHNVALRADGSIASWGCDDYGQVSGTPGGNDFLAVAAGEHHNLALRSDGTIAAWGYAKHGLVSDTPTLGGFTAIACGDYYNLAIGVYPRPRPTVTLGCSVVHLGNGLDGVTFTVHANGTPGKSFFADVTFEGINDGRIRQVHPAPGVNVHAESDADLWDVLGEPVYEKTCDSYFLEPFSDGDIMVLEEGENYYRIVGGTGAGRAFEDAPLAYICTTGDLRYEGTVYRCGVTYSFSGVVDLPEPAGVFLLAVGASALVRRRRQSPSPMHRRAEAAEAERPGD